MKKKSTAYLASLKMDEQTKINPKLLRIILADDFTRIDFGHAAPWIYDRGGWIKIDRETYIQVHGIEKRFSLKDAINIPISPDQRDYESTQDWQFFSLIFEPIPIKECFFDLIENEHLEDKIEHRFFNFRNVKIEKPIALLD